MQRRKNKTKPARTQRPSKHHLIRMPVDTAVTERLREDIGELAQKAAIEMVAEGEKRELELREQEARHQYEERESYYCLVQHRVDLAAGRTWFEAETLDTLPYGIRPLRTIGSSADQAVRRMNWVFAHQLVALKLYDEPGARKRAAKVKFVQAEVRQ